MVYQQQLVTFFDSRPEIKNYFVPFSWNGPANRRSDAIAAFWDNAPYQQALAREATERRTLTKG